MWDINTACMCVYTCEYLHSYCTCVCVHGLHLAGKLWAAAASCTLGRGLHSINASLPPHLAACKRGEYPPGPVRAGRVTLGWARGSLGGTAW